MPIDAAAIVDNVMTRWPATIRVFLDHDTHCVGCPVGRFHSVGDVCLHHGIDVDQLLRALRDTAAGPGELPSSE